MYKNILWVNNVELRQGGEKVIVLTSVNEGYSRSVVPGDEFHLSIADGVNGTTDVIVEEIAVAKIIDYWASFRFTGDDGTCVGFHLSGFFGNRNELPDEIKNAVRVQDLTPEQYGNFVKSLGIKI